MKEFFLKVSRTKKGQINLNGAYLSVFDGEIETRLIDRIDHATEKGWRSSKPIFEELEVIYSESEVDLIITENCANRLMAKYQGVKVKEWIDHNIPGPSAAHAIANFITKNGTDPYDRG
jgi:hypothetical protein